MKRLFVFSIVFLISFSSFCQVSELPITFKANEEANVVIGKNWDYTYTPLKNQINVEFDGFYLKMYYENGGKIYWETDVVDFDRKEKKNYDKLESELFILNIDDNGVTNYVVIERSYIYDEVTTQIKIPSIVNGLVFSYHYYQQF